MLCVSFFYFYLLYLPTYFVVVIFKGRKWFKGFLERHPKISEKRAEYLSKTRGKVTEEYIREWFHETTELLGNDIDILLHGEPNRIWNMDETSLYTNPSG